MPRRVLLLLSTCLLSGVLAPAGAAQERESLQALLQRLRQQRDVMLSSLQGSVDTAIQALEAQAVVRDLAGMEASRAKLVQLGPEIAPLLVEKIDPGTSPTDPERLRAQYVALALADLRARSILTRVLEIVQAGSTEGRQNAIRVLGASADAERAAPALVGIVRGNFPELRGPALVALARLGGPLAESALKEALGDARPEVVRNALEALAAGRNAALAGGVLRITASPGDAFRILDALLAYYRAVPEAVDAAHASALVRLATDPSAPAADRLRVLEILPRFADKFDVEVRKSLKSLTESPAREIREGALVVMILAGDKNARRDLLAPYDERIDRNKDFAAAWEDRGSVLYRIGDYRDALNDYKQALKLSENDLRMRQDTLYVGVARCYARMGKLKDAGQTLERAPLTRKQLVELKTDPAFDKLIEDRKYRELFEEK